MRGLLDAGLPMMQMSARWNLRTFQGGGKMSLLNNKKYSTKKIWEITMSFLAVGFNDQRKCITFS